LLENAQEMREKFCFCFSIDALDEFDEPTVSYSHLAAGLRTLNWKRTPAVTISISGEKIILDQASITDHIKICVSNLGMPEITVQLMTPQRNASRTPYKKRYLNSC
jgi:hypothetical protein